MAEDLVDKVRRQWGEVRPDLDTTVMAVVGRVLRLASLIRRLSDDLLGEYGLTRPEFDVLSAVLRNDGLTPGQLTREVLSSGAAVSKRLDRLERLGYVVRETDTRDRRVVRVRATDTAVELLDELVPRQLDVERRATEGLTERQQRQLADLLSTMLLTVEGHAGTLP